MRELNKHSTWKTGDVVAGVYFGVPFSGVLNESTRPTPDYRNVIFGVTLTAPVELFGTVRERIEVLGGETIHITGDV